MSDSSNSFDHMTTIARDGSVADRVALAGRPDTPPELLYFLSEDAELAVRRVVAENPHTPRQADVVLGRDADPGVRCVLARKIVGEGLGDDERSQLWRMGFTILETLARDSSIRVRRSLADAIRHMFHVPHDIAADLARDPERRVAAPVLRHSPVLTDDDLIDIVEDGAADWAHQAIAARENVSERVSAALVDAGANPTVTRLLRNDTADIGEPALETIVARAPDIEAWHEPLVKRPHLPLGLARKIAGFVKAPLKAALAGRREKPDRLSAEDPAKSSAVGWSAPAEKGNGRFETPKERALRLHGDKKLNDAVIEMALNANEREFVMASIALRAGVPLWGVERIVDGRSAKGVTALCWKAGIKMRFAIELQRRLARVVPSSVIHARDGFDYPFSEEDMQGRLDLLLA
ncbi:MAG: hypothetical protein ACI9JL_001314 [Paracoccaceae bacterium]|jgi:uncharacterized protein (DUF2336 family)